MKNTSLQGVPVLAQLSSSLCGLPISSGQADTHFTQILISGGFSRYNGMVGKYTLPKSLTLNKNCFKLGRKSFVQQAITDSCNILSILTQAESGSAMERDCFSADAISLCACERTCVCILVYLLKMIPI